MPSEKRSLVGKGNNSDYLSLSPGAAYDANRNSRALERKQNSALEKTNEDYEYT